MLLLKNASRLALMVSFAIVCCDHATATEPIRQPASVLPWQPEQVGQLPRAFRTEQSAAMRQPAWLLAEPTPKSAPTSASSHLPMVETESYAEIGTLQLDSAEQRRLAEQRQRVERRSPARSFSLLRALGFQNRQSSTRQ
ncbi:MAG: hypothetical protein AAGD11_17825 [Planctomycetota bacterium]